MTKQNSITPYFFTPITSLPILQWFSGKSKRNSTAQKRDYTTDEFVAKYADIRVLPDYIKLKQYFEDPNAQDVLLNLANYRPRMVLLYLSALKRNDNKAFQNEMKKPFIKSLLNKAAHKAAEIDPLPVFIYCNIIKNEDYAREVFIEAAKKWPGTAISSYDDYKDTKYANDVLSIAIPEALKQNLTSLIFSESKNIKEHSSAKKAFKEAATKNPVSAIEHLDKITKLDNSSEIFNILATSLVGKDFISALTLSLKENIPKELKDALLKELQKVNRKDLNNPLEAVAFRALYNHTRKNPARLTDPKINQELENALKNEIEKNPKSIFQLLSLFKDKPYAKELLVKAAKLEPQAAFEYFSDYKDKSYAKDVLLTASEAAPDWGSFKLELYKDEPYAKEILNMLAEKAPETIINNYLIASPKGKGFEDIKLKAWKLAAQTHPHEVLRIHFCFQDSKEGKAILKEAAINASYIDPISAFYFSNAFKDEDYAPEVLARSGRLISYLRKLYNIEGIRNRWVYLHNTLYGENWNLPAAIRKFNEKHNLSLECTGISSGRGFGSNNQYEFVLTNTFKNGTQEIVRIGLSMKEISDLNKKTYKLSHKEKIDAILKLLEEKYKVEKESFKSQRTIWNNGSSYNLPTNGKTAVMFASVPDMIPGTETDILKLAEIFNKHFSTSISAICMENKDKWDKLEGVGQNEQKGVFPQATNADKKTILETFETSLRKAIDEGKEAFVFYYLMHGSKDGSMRAEDKVISAKELAEILTKKHGDKYICDQLDINIIAESCHSGSQLDLILSCIKEKGKEIDKEIPVKNLRIVSTSAKNTPSEANADIATSSVISDLMKDDKSGTFTYYLVQYFEIISHLKENKVELKCPIGTLEHAIQYADRMARADSRIKQDAQGYHHTTYRKSGYFTQISNDHLLKMLIEIA